MFYHGNYCGPGWSEGKYQNSVVGTMPPTDEFDATCQEHDAAYATKSGPKEADYKFYKANIGKSLKRTAAAVAVGLQGFLRPLDSSKQSPKETITTMTNAPKLRGSTQTKQTKTSPPGVATVPASYGYTLRMTPPKVVRNGNTARITGSDFASNVFAVNSSNYEPAASVCITPAYFQNAMLGSLSRAYEKFRVNKATLQYIPSVPTSTQGQIVMTSTSTVKEPFIPGSSSTFLSRALSQGNAVAAPIWKETYLEIPPSKEWSIVDLLIDADLDDSIPQEVQVYTTCDSTTVAGILVLHYEMEFCDPLYTYHSTMLPCPKGNGVIITFTDRTAINPVTNNIILGNASVGFTEGFGSVFRCVFQQARSTLPAGPATWSAVASVLTTTANTTTTLSSATSLISMVTGTVLYGVLGLNGLALYASYDTAVVGSLNGQLFYQTPTTVVGIWSFIIEMVRLSNADRLTTQ